MKFWKKKDTNAKSTNPFEEQEEKPCKQPEEDSYSFSTEYSQTPTASAPFRSRYSKPQPTSSARERNYTQDRQDLFRGQTDLANRYDSNGQEDVYSQSKFAEGDEDQEVAQVRQKIRNVKQDTLASTRNALQKINETEVSATNTMNMLGTQSTQIASVGRNLDISKAYSDRASAQAGELKQLNRSIFIPVIKNPFTKGSRERKAMERVNRNHQEHMNEREDIRQFEYDSNVRIEDAQRKANRETAREGSHKGRLQADRNRYQFEADEEDDAIEDEIDGNLDLLGDATGRLKAMASTMNDELDNQNKQLNKVNKKVDPINAKLISTTYTLNSTR